jgi:hypothetical protein
MKFDISATICTLDRVQYLRKAIDSLVKQTLTPERFETLAEAKYSGAAARRSDEAYLKYSRGTPCPCCMRRADMNASDHS